MGLGSAQTSLLMEFGCCSVSVVEVRGSVVLADWGAVAEDVAAGIGGGVARGMAYCIWHAVQACVVHAWAAQEPSLLHEPTAWA